MRSASSIVTPLPVAAVVLLCGCCATEARSPESRRVQYDCQGIKITVEYGEKAARLVWPDGEDVLRLQRRSTDSEVTRYESRHNELRVGRDLLWGREGSPPRSCSELR